MLVINHQHLAMHQPHLLPQANSQHKLPIQHHYKQLILVDNPHSMEPLYQQPLLLYQLNHSKVMLDNHLLLL